ncbi:hypothetical protein ACFLZV_02125, partial [Candidatus Margulisiibacteriota bacterium]
YFQLHPEPDGSFIVEKCFNLKKLYSFKLTAYVLDKGGKTETLEEWVYDCDPIDEEEAIKKLIRPGKDIFIELLFQNGVNRNKELIVPDEIVVAGQTYKIIGFLEKLGGINKGHYKAYVRSQDNEKTVCCDDEIVTVQNIPISKQATKVHKQYNSFVVLIRYKMLQEQESEL